MAIRPTEWDGVYTDGSWLLTRNRKPGVSVYGETLHREGGIEYRRWDANRSKLASFLKCGGQVWGFRGNSAVLYLGAGSGTTVSHVSDVCAEGTITAVEISSRSFRDLLRLAETRENLVPVLGDAWKPEIYGSRVGRVDVLYQDVAERGQEDMFLKNVEWLRSAGIGYLMVKARSEDVTAEPNRIFEAAKRRLTGAGLSIVDFRLLSAFQADHAAIVIRKP